MTYSIQSYFNDSPQSRRDRREIWGFSFLAETPTNENHHASGNGLTKKILRELCASNDHAMAEDTLHEGFIKVFQNIKSFKGEGSLKGWVKRIMINTALEKFRKKSPLYVFWRN